jgi:hypothetical protein
MKATGKHRYFASPAAIYDVFSSQELGIARQSLLNYWQKTEEPYENAICVIRKGELERKTKNKKGDILNTELSRTLTIAEAKEQYDENCKNILSNKVILAWILRRTVKEFAVYSIDRIMECIEKPTVSKVCVNPGLTNHQKITGINTEDAVNEEGVIYYDLRFFAIVPKTQEKIRLIINVEAQKSFYPGYHIETRGIFYAARMLSAQLGTEFAIPNYQNLKKVYSIWICMNAPNYIGNAISEYKIAKEDIISGIPDNVEAYDKLSVIMICLNQKKEDQTNDSFLKMMNLLLNSHISAKEKKKILQTDYHIPMTIRLGEELNFMCNLSDLLEEEVLNRKETEIVLKMIAQGLSDETIMECVTISKERLMQIKNSQNLNTK